MILWTINPIALSLGPLEIRWYGIFFCAGVFWVSQRLFHSHVLKTFYPTDSMRDSFIAFFILSAFLGAKLGYVFFYTPVHYYSYAFFSFQGFSFHGGILGVILALLFSGRSYRNILMLSDELVTHLPIAIFLGRLGNFFNSELLGRPWQHPYAFGFPFGELAVIPRHPSQLYEAAGEGLLLGMLMHYLCAAPCTAVAKNGKKTACFLMLYGVIRLFLEGFRCPDPQIGFLFGSWTMGQLLCLALVLLGFILYTYTQWSRNFYENLS